MRVCYFALLAPAALDVMATKSPENPRSIVHVVHISDIADHRSDVSINRALRAQAALDDDEERWWFPFFTSATEKLAQSIGRHKSLTEGEGKYEFAGDTWKTLIKDDDMVDKMGKYYFGQRNHHYETSDEALADYLETSYTLAGIAQAIRRTEVLRPNSPEAKRLNRLHDIVAKDSKLQHFTPKFVVQNFDTKNDADFFAPTVITFLIKYAGSEEKAYAAIFEYFEYDLSRFSSAVRLARGSEDEKKALDLIKPWMLRNNVRSGANRLSEASDNYKMLSPDLNKKLNEEFKKKFKECIVTSLLVTS